jgi:hypothetical protein
MFFHNCPYEIRKFCILIERNQSFVSCRYFIIEVGTVHFSPKAVLTHTLVLYIMIFLSIYFLGATKPDTFIHL